MTTGIHRVQSMHTALLSDFVLIFNASSPDSYKNHVQTIHSPCVSTWVCEPASAEKCLKPWRIQATKNWLEMTGGFNQWFNGVP